MLHRRFSLDIGPRKAHLKGMMRSLRSLFGGRSQPSAPSTAVAADALDLPRPADQTYVIGDLHGRADLLEQILELIDAHVGGTGATNPMLVFVGDYIDLGPDSARTLTRVRELAEEFPANITCLMGNHERMLLDFLADPGSRGPRWLRAGAAETLRSFGVATVNLTLDGPSPAAFKEAADVLLERLPDGMVDWVKSLKTSWNSGNLWVVHAGADPAHDMEDQSDRVLLWGHPEFDSALRGDGVWIAHGHTEIDAPFARDGRIATDTGAWRTGRLTACAIRPEGRYDFLQT